MKKMFKKLLYGFLLIIFFIWLVSLNAGSKTKNIEYGVTFSQPYASSLRLNWKEVYLSILEDLNPKHLRISAYWDEVEKQQGIFKFEDLDFQVNEASKRNVNIVLGVGRRLPRWPECHDPNWLNSLTVQVQQNAQLSYIEEVVNRYKNNQSIKYWQVENEPFLGTFGICPKLDENFFETELSLVKKLDPGRKIIVTDSGELNFWLKAGSKGDIFGTTLYRYVFSDVLKRYWTNPIPALFYRFKAGVLRFVRPGKQIAIIELQGEPWTTKGILSTPIEEQFRTMSFEHFNTIVKVAKNTGFNPQYFWGVEWWYWMKTQNHPEFWDKAKELFSN